MTIISGAITFTLKRGDTLPILVVPLYNPDGSRHDLTGSTAWKLFIWLSDGTKVTRDMEVVAVEGGEEFPWKLSYAWQDSDWDVDNPEGFLILSVDPLPAGDRPHSMEYEVTAPAGRLTFPNYGFDILLIGPDIL